MKKIVTLSLIIMGLITPISVKANTNQVQLSVGVRGRTITDTINDFDFSTVNVIYNGYLLNDK